MGLSIRNSRAEQLAREVAKESGENLTEAIVHALEERLERLKGRRAAEDVTQEILKISKRCAKLPEIDKRSPDEILGYDNLGVS